MAEPIEQAIVIVRKHKLAISVSFLVAIIILYIVSKAQSGGGGSGSSESPLDLQYQKLAAATDVQQSQIAAQLEAERIKEQGTTIQQANAIAGTLALTQLQGEISTTQQVNALTEREYEVGTVANIEARKIDATTEILMKQLDNQAALQSAVVAQAGRDKGRSSTGWTQIISALFGQGPQAIAANQPSEVAGSNMWGNIIGGVTKGLFGLF